jgi:hypothetical protein
VRSGHSYLLDEAQAMNAWDDPHRVARLKSDPEQRVKSWIAERDIAVLRLEIRLLQAAHDHPYITVVLALLLLCGAVVAAAVTDEWSLFWTVLVAVAGTSTGLGAILHRRRRQYMALKEPQHE